MTTGTTPDGRTRHYGTFYGLPDADRTDHPGDGPRVENAAPLLLIWGNCQAEALRVLLSASPTLELRTVRIPPVFELTEPDLDHLRRLAGQADILLTQPVHDDYGNLPLGSAQVAAMMPAGRTVLRWPVLRFAGFHPFQAIIRDPADGANDPPLVPYHDLRTLATARWVLRGHRAPADTGSDSTTGGHSSPVDLLDIQPAESACAELAEASRAELRRREQAQCDVTISDLFDRPAAGDMFTINHPANRVLVELARRVQRALGRPSDATDPGRNLLGEVIAPSPAAALRALGLAPAAPAGSAARKAADDTAASTADDASAPPTTDETVVPAAPDEPGWLVRGTRIPAREVHDRQLAWYLQHPAVVDAGWQRHQQTMRVLGLA